MGTLIVLLSGQGKLDVCVKSMVDFSGPVGRTSSLKEIAVLCINTGMGGEGPGELITKGTLPVTAPDFCCKTGWHHFLCEQ